MSHGSTLVLTHARGAIVTGTTLGPTQASTLAVMSTPAQGEPTPQAPRRTSFRQRWTDSRIGVWVARHEFVGNVLTLLTGTAFAQALGLAIYPIVTRMYSAADMGVFNLFMAFVGFIVTIAALRYDLAIVPAASDDEAATLLSLATRCNLVISLLTTIVMAVFAMPIASALDSPALAPWLWLAGPMVFITAQTAVMGYWLNRKKHYSIASTNQMMQSLTMSGTRVGFGAFGSSVAGLLASQGLGFAVALTRLVVKTRSELKAPRAASLRQVASKYRRMPLVNGPNALVDAIRLNGITLLIGRFFEDETVGNFSVAWLLIQAPLSLINGALSQVFFQKMAVTPRGDMLRLVKGSLVRSLLLGIIPFAMIWFAAPPLLPWVLGGDYHLVGVLAAALVPWLYLNLATSPVSMLFIVVQKQGIMLAFGIAYMITPLSILWFFHRDIVTTIQLVSWAMAGLLVIFCVLALWAARQFDAGRTPDLSLGGKE